MKKCVRCKRNYVEIWNRDVGVCESCLNKVRVENMKQTRKDFEKARKINPSSVAGLTATDWM